MKVVASCSFGKDSIAAIITWLKQGRRLDYAIYARIMFDSELSAELPEHEEWIHSVGIPKLERDWGVKTKIVQAEKTYKTWFYRVKKRGKRKGLIYGFPYRIGPWCNSRLKVDPIKKHARNYFEIIGIAADEPRRAKERSGAFYPLVECGITEENAFEICEEHGLLSSAYDDQIRRLGCWFCHNQRIGELKLLRERYPQLWKILLDLDKDSPVVFKQRHTVKYYEDRWSI